MTKASLGMRRFRDIMRSGVLGHGVRVTLIWAFLYLF
jgi:uncharacterized membrane protein YhaH (DUF805 family)